jgi:ubiquinone biosynthesis protein
MLPIELIPSQLVLPSERAPVIIIPPKPPSRFRSAYVFLRFWQVLGSLVFLRLVGMLTPKRFGARVRPFLEQMGAIWIKAGKILALRKDLFSQELAEELDKLRDRGPGFPFPLAKQIVEQELGGPLERFFDEFSPTPFASTTVAQIHQAHLRQENVTVAVKIQHPYAKQAYSSDIAMMRRVARLLESLSILPRFRWSDVCWELEQSMQSEIDSRYEAAALRKLSKTAATGGVYFPEVFLEYSTERLLVMEFIRGALVSDFMALGQSDPPRLADWLAANNINPQWVAKRLFRTVFRQILEDNFFHADLHPGNIILLRNSRIAFIDCRNAGSLEGEQVAKLRLFVQALAAGEYSAAVDYFFLLTSNLPAVDMAEVKSGMVRLMRAWETEVHVRHRPYRSKSMTNLMGELNMLALSSGFSVQWSLSKMVGALAHLDTSLAYLWPRMNYLKQLRGYFQRAEMRHVGAELAGARSRISRSAIAAWDIPRRFSESMLLQQILSRRNAQVISGSATRIGTFLSAILATTAFALLGGEIFLFCTFLSQHSAFPVREVMGRQIFSAMSELPYMNLWVWLVILVGMFSLQRRAARFGSNLGQPQESNRRDNTARVV